MPRWPDGMEVRECKTRSFSNEQYVQRQSLARSFQGFRHRSEVDSVVSTVSCMETCKHRGTPEVFVRASSSPQGTLAPTPTRTSSDQASAVIKRQCRRLILWHQTQHSTTQSTRLFCPQIFVPSWARRHPRRRWSGSRSSRRQGGPCHGAARSRCASLRACSGASSPRQHRARKPARTRKAAAAASPPVVDAVWARGRWPLDSGESRIGSLDPVRNAAAPDRTAGPRRRAGGGVGGGVRVSKLNPW